MSLGYWRYYDADFTWDDHGGREFAVLPDADYTAKVLRSSGIGGGEADALFSSGYVCIPGFDVVIDRYYGGVLRSVDDRTRFSAAGLRQRPTSPASSVLVEYAKSWKNVAEIVDRLRSRAGKNMLFRGQIRHYLIQRRIPNPHFVIPGIGEVSLLPSVWRPMLIARPTSFHRFSGLSLFDWSHILYSVFDLDDIRARHEALLRSGESICTLSDMEDCSDPVLREFGAFRMDISMHLNHSLAGQLSMLLQHYGLYSHVLDLTSSLDVARFFATHKYEKVDGRSTYKFVGTNDRRSVIYVMAMNKTEMESHDPLERTLSRLMPLRPARQGCVVATSSNFAVNLPADFLVGVIGLDFDSDEPGPCSTRHLFPPESEDRFLRAMKTHPYAVDRLTEF